MSLAQRRVIALLLLLAAWLSYFSATSLDSPVLPSVKTAHQQQSSPAIRGENPADKLNWNNWTGDPITVFTAALTAFNGLLFVSTLGLWLATRKSTAISQRALTELEAPFLNVQISKPGLNLKGRTVAFGQLKWRVVNYGRTPATILEIFDTIRQVEQGHGYAPPIDLLKEHGNLMPYGVIAAPNGGRTEDFPYMAIADLLAEPGTLVALDHRNIFFLGYIKYADIFGSRFVLGFSFLFDRYGQRWILAGEGRYNYCQPDTGAQAPGRHQPSADPNSVRSDDYPSIRKTGAKAV